MESFSMSMKISDFLKEPCIRPFADRLGLKSHARKEQTFEQMVTDTSAWTHADVASGIRRIQEVIDAGTEVCRDIYTDEERKRDKKKAAVALYYFPACRQSGCTVKENVLAPFVLITPGGAYSVVACTVEGFPVAARLNELGYHAFVLNYRTGIATLEHSKEDLMAALRYISAHQIELGVRMEDYAMMGFSAGGHLTSLAMTDVLDFSGEGIPEPGTIILGYPLQNFYEGGFIIKVCKLCAYGLFATRKKVRAAYVPEHLAKQTVKVYLWQTKDDESVPFHANSRTLYDALQRAGICVKFRIAKHGLHGMGIAHDSDAAGWLEEAVEYWQSKYV